MKTYSSIPSPAETPESSASYWRMFVLGLIVIAPSAFSGIMTVYPAIAIPGMTLNIANASWFGSMASLTAPVGSVLIGCIIDKLGRRIALLFSIFPTLLGWTLLAWNPSLAILLIGQALNGVSNGAAMYPSQVYASECIMVNHMGWRDNYLSWQGLASAFGMCFALMLAYFVDYQRIAVISATMACVIFLLIYAFIPESPSWLYHRGRIGDAEWSQSKLGISQPILQARATTAAAATTTTVPSSDEEASESPSELEDPQASTSTATTIDTTATATTVTTAESSTALPAVTNWDGFKQYAAKIKRKDVYKPLIMMSVLFVLLTFCGAITVMVYLVNVINENKVPVNVTAAAAAAATSTNVDSLSVGQVRDLRLSESYWYGAVAGILILVANCMVCAMVRHAGAKRILCGAALLVAFGFVLLGYTTTSAQTGYATGSFSLHIIAVWMIVFAFNFGVMNLPNSLLGEIFPADAKGYASVVCVLEFVMTGVLLKVHPYARLALGGYLYFGYAAVSALAAIYVAVFMVDTVGKTVDQIKSAFMK